MQERIENAIRQRMGQQGRLVVLTGAGISAESGIPTFRGPEGYWTVGSVNYRPEQMATYQMFSRHPESVWQWYLYRLGVCREAGPNAGHRAVERMERLLGDRFLLVTQNVDGLHLRAGNSLERTYAIHGNIELVRCGDDCCRDVFPMPADVSTKSKREPLDDQDREALRCPRCAAWLRPHVLWFDEYYDEQWYRFDSSIHAAASADLLLVVGTAGATNLPSQMGAVAARNDALIIDVNPNANPFSALAQRSGGFFLQQGAGGVLPRIADCLEA